MSTRRALIAALPMYDLPERRAATDALWAALRARLERSLPDAPLPTSLERSLDYQASWTDGRLLLGQACEYPLAQGIQRHVQLVATPDYEAPGCEPFRYASAVLVRAQDPARTLADLRARRCVINDWQSNSGMNLLRAAIAPLALGAPFFGSVQVSGAHRASIAALLDQRADTTAVDAVSWALCQDVDPSLSERLRVLAWTPTSPALPFITARRTGAAELTALRSALSGVCADPAQAATCRLLRLRGVQAVCDPTLGEVRALATRAMELGYPLLR